MTSPRGHAHRDKTAAGAYDVLREGGPIALARGSLVWGTPLKQGSSASDLLNGQHMLSSLLTALFVGLLLTLELTAPASAYRPFDGTNAAVVDVGEAEIQLQPAGELGAGSRNVLTGPYTVFDYGFAERWELILENKGQAPPAGTGPSPVSDEVMLKYVVQPGVLQNKPGLSIATEFGPLLPNIGEPGMGSSGKASCRNGGNGEPSI